EYLASKADQIRGYFVFVGFYMENFTEYARVSPEDNATVEFTFPLNPDTKIPLVDTANDIGAVVAHILDHPDEYLGSVVEISGGYFEVQDMATTFTDVTGKPARYVQIPYEYLPSEEIREMFHGLQEFGLFSGEAKLFAQNEKIDYTFTTPTEFWKNRGWNGPAPSSQ
ncbi:hypothetical protein FB639_005095, partial [Coemansia asiatica]